MVAGLRSDFNEPDGEKIKGYLTWVANNYRHISEIAPILEENLAYNLFKVKNIEAHSKILLDCFSKNKINFLQAYNAKAETITSGS